MTKSLYGKITESVAVNFWKKVNFFGPNGCWVWTGAKQASGHGTLGLGGRNAGNVSAHRWSYAYCYGVDPGELCVCHKCDNRPCVNPEHLFLGTQAENMADMARKGRAAWHKKTRPDDTRAKIAAALRGRRLPEEVRSKLSAIRTGRKFPNRKRVDADGRKRMADGTAASWVVLRSSAGADSPPARCKLSENDVRRILESHDTNTALALRFGVSPSSVCDIRKRRTWNWVN